MGLRMKAVALFSGGLDSTLAAKIIASQGIEVTILHFLTPFCHCDGIKGCRCPLAEIAAQIDAEFQAIYLGKEYIEMIKKPAHGYGKNLNPCVDCKIMMLRRAKEYMQKIGASFAVTGEVLGQRPLSQHGRALATITRESGLEGLIVRPLSALMLEETTPEKNKWVAREKLYGINGRTRKPQFELAERFGIKRFLAPAGGCLLTERQFCAKLKDLLTHDRLDLAHVELLKAGRYFRLSPDAMLFVGRDEKENTLLLRLAKQGDMIFEPRELPGPVGVGRGTYNEALCALAARIIAAYTAQERATTVATRTHGAPRETVRSAQGFSREELAHWRV